jgi:hypothetical protein
VIPVQVGLSSLFLSIFSRYLVVILSGMVDGSCQSHDTYSKGSSFAAAVCWNGNEDNQCSVPEE